MAKPPELWAFLLANLGLFLISSLLTGLCYLTYSRRGGDRSFAIATAGFGLVVLGGLVEPVYVFVISTNDLLDTTEIYLMQGTETILIALGLGFLFYAVMQFSSDTPSKEEKQSVLTDEDLAWSDSEQSGD